MKRRPFGASGIDVSELAVGGGRVGGILIHQDDDTKRQALRRAFDGGMNWIDTAASYGDGVSEESIGWLLKEMPDEPYISTKFSITSPDDIPGQIEESLRASLKRLGRDSVHLLQLHNFVVSGGGARNLTMDQILGPNGVADGLDRLKEKGLIKLAGFTAKGDTQACIDVINSGRMDSAQVYYNILNPSAGMRMPDAWRGQDFNGIIAACKCNGVAIMNIRVFAAGAVATADRPGNLPIMTANSDDAAERKMAAAVYDALGDEYGTRAQTALRFALANPDISCIVIGMAELEHLDQAMAAAEMGPLPEGALNKLYDLYEKDFGRQR